MNRVMRLMAIILTIGCAKLSWSSHYTLELLQTVASSEAVEKIVKKQEEEGFQLVGIRILDKNHVPGCDQFEVMFKKFEVGPDEESTRNVPIMTQLHLKKSKIKIGVKRPRKLDE